MACERDEMALDSVVADVRFGPPIVIKYCICSTDSVGTSVAYISVTAPFS